jgi:hypothetical protein
MPVSSIDLIESNYTGNSNLICIHNPVIFIVQANYIGAAPEYLEALLYDEDDVLLGTFRCIPYLDVTTTSRQFIFVADQIMRGYMGNFDDVLQTGGSLEYIEDRTKVFKLRFQKYMEAITGEYVVVALHGVRQFGDDQNAVSIYNNEPQVYYGAEDMPVYVYFYNNDPDAYISMTIGGGSDEVLLDYDDEEFADFDDELLTALTA